MENGKYVLKVAVMPFYCGICGEFVKIGETYAESNGKKSCLCVMPARKLKPLSPTQSEQKEDKAMMHLRVENLKMRIELETLSMHPDGKAAKKIIAKYIRKRKIRNELYLSTQN